MPEVREIEVRTSAVIEELVTRGFGDLRADQLDRGEAELLWKARICTNGDLVPREDAFRAIEDARGMVDRERQRYLRLADDVLRGCRSLYELFVENVRDERTAMREGQGHAPRIGALREARTLSAAIGDGDLVRELDRALEEYGVTGLVGPAREAAERLARGILRRQIDAGEARVRWEERGGSQEARIRTAETVLTVARVGAAVGVPLETEEWVAAVSGALIADGAPAEQAEKIARHAQAVMIGSGFVEMIARAAEAAAC